MSQETRESPAAIVKRGIDLYEMVFRAKGNTTNKKDADDALNKIVTDEAQRAVFRDVMRQVAANQASGMTEEARRLRAQKAARGRWEKKDAQKTDN